MSPDTLNTLMLLGVTILLTAMTAVFVFHEFSFVMLKQPQIKRLEESPSRIDRLVAKNARKLDHYIAVDQLGITITTIATGWVGQPVVTSLLRGPFEAIGAFPGAVPVISFVSAFALITGAQMLAGELMPKSIALRNVEKVAKLVVIPVEFIARLFHPVILALNGFGMFTVRMFGFSTEGGGHHAQALPAEELVLLIQSSARAGTLNVDPMLLRRALHFSDITAQDLIVPRQDIIALDLRMTIDELLQIAREHGFTRYPVYETTIDTVVGVLNVKDLVQISANGEVGYVPNWRRWIRPLPTLSEEATIEQVLARLSQDKQPMILLIDEFGGTAGLLTVADIADELTGGAEDIQPLGNLRYLIKGETAVSTIESTLDITLGDDDRPFDSVGGLVMDALGRIPAVGDEVTVDGSTIRVAAMRGRRVTEVRLTLPEPYSPDS